MFAQNDPAIDDFYSTKIEGVEEEHPTGELDTLDEPVWKTFGRDIMQIGYKLVHVTFPLRGTFMRIKELKDWDIWGPLILCLFLAIVLTFSTSDHNQQALLFGGVFVIVWVGSAVITINAILLGTSINFCHASIDKNPLLPRRQDQFLSECLCFRILPWSVGYCGPCDPNRHAFLG